MSIRDLKNLLCATCAKDVLHIAYKCTVCGSIFETPTEARARAMKQIWARKGFSRQRAGASMAVHTKAKREYEKANGISKLALKDRAK